MTPAYSALPSPVVGKIRELLPECRVVFVMRNPIERAWSHFRSNAEKAKIDTRVVGMDIIRRQVDSPNSQLRTAYTRTIETWQQYFARDRILYLFYDDLLADRDSFLAAVCRFLGIPFDRHYFADTRDAVVNKSMALEIDPGARAYLARKYHDEIAALQRRFGGHTDRWLEDCERLIADGVS
jgi:Sulfotransferase family